MQKRFNYHAAFWWTIDQMAERNGMKPSALAKAAGLDPTAFNKSKRFKKDGTPRWLSTETIAKAANATNTTEAEYIKLMTEYAALNPL